MRVWLFGLILISAFSANAGDSIISTNLVKTPELTIENLKIILKQEKVKHADVVLQQAIVETGWFKCTHCSLSRNNIFGFYYKKKYLVFTDWVDCVRYYKRWQ
ncbi:MAG: glucosaminidase domain-containing protein, partial [Crocinitomicaceae bacterium]|nr:glucosaminidase domain-containing protein [Crocinitomicaceae bacterium]